MILCDRCGTEKHDNKVVVQWSTINRTPNEAKIFVFCPQCYEEEAINAI